MEEKRRKLFCEYGPVCYEISLVKENLKRTFRDMLHNRRFAKTRENQILPCVWKSHMSMMLRPLLGIDMQLQENKVQNLRLAAAQIDGVVVAPGEVFSLWALVGRPTRRKGYLDGMVIAGGRPGKGLAGGLCQLANLIHYLVLHTPMEVIELHHHSDALFPDAGRRVPFGTGTSIVYKNCDYRFQNTTPHPIQVRIWIEKQMLMGEIRSTVLPEKRYRLKEEEHHYTRESDGYYRNSLVYQVITDQAGELLEKKLILQNHSKVMYDPALIPQEEIRI
ncbi:MAG: VanW family protein [Oscillospiraceae bacterium]|nr:VanW family protein [Oscillospiraceae bacterium]